MASKLIFLVPHQCVRLDDASIWEYDGVDLFIAVRSRKSDEPESSWFVPKFTIYDLVEWAKLEVIQTPDFVARAAIASLNKSDTRELLWRITVPTLMIVGEKDIITPPAESRALSDGIPNSTLAVIENAGHFPMLEQPLEFNRALRVFLDQHASPSNNDGTR